MRKVVKLPDFEQRCIMVAAKKFTKLSNAKNWLRDQHGIICPATLLLFINPNLRQ